MVTVEGFTGYTNLSALLVFLTNEYKLVRRVSRYAALTNDRWFEKTLRIVSCFVPAVKIKVFKTDERQAAMNWLLQ